MADAMIIAMEKDSFTLLNELLKQFGDGDLSYDELWAEIFIEFGINSIDEPTQATGI